MILLINWFVRRDIVNLVSCTFRRTFSFLWPRSYGLSMIGDSGIFISMWIGGLTFSCIYIIVLLILFTRILTIPSIRTTSSIHYSTFPFICNATFYIFSIYDAKSAFILFPAVFIIFYQSISNPASLNLSSQPNNAS